MASTDLPFYDPRFGNPDIIDYHSPLTASPAGSAFLQLDYAVPQQSPWSVKAQQNESNHREIESSIQRTGRSENDNRKEALSSTSSGVGSKPLRRSTGLRTSDISLSRLSEVQEEEGSQSPTRPGTATAVLPITPRAQDSTDATPNRRQRARSFSLSFIKPIACQIYHASMLYLPGLYKVRITRLFDDAEKSLHDIAMLLAEKQPFSDAPSNPGSPARRMYADLPSTGIVRPFAPRRGDTAYSLNVSNLDRNEEPPSYKRMKDSWDSFIEALVSEWKSFNLLTVLLLSAIIAILQIEVAAQDIVIRTAALLSLIFALLSLVAGCIYIGRFHEMRKPYKGAHWAWQVAQSHDTDSFWNAWVFLSLPAVWLAWSLLSFLVCILAYIWRTGSPTQNSPPPFSQGALLASRVAVTFVLAIGFVYLFLSALKFKEYEGMYQESTHRIIKTWLEKKKPGKARNPPQPVVQGSLLNPYAYASPSPHIASSLLTPITGPSATPEIGGQSSLSAIVAALEKEENAGIGIEVVPPDETDSGSVEAEGHSSEVGHLSARSVPRSRSSSA